MVGHRLWLAILPPLVLSVVTMAACDLSLGGARVYCGAGGDCPAGQGCNAAGYCEAGAAGTSTGTTSGSSSGSGSGSATTTGSQGSSTGGSASSTASTSEMGTGTGTSSSGSARSSTGASTSGGSSAHCSSSGSSGSGSGTTGAADGGCSAAADCSLLGFASPACCEARCVDIAGSMTDCGGCGLGCAVGTTCLDGGCLAPCASGGPACPAGYGCVGDLCALSSCSPGPSDVGSNCVSSSSEPGLCASQGEADAGACAVKTCGASDDGAACVGSGTAPTCCVDAIATRPWTDSSTSTAAVLSAGESDGGVDGEVFSYDDHSADVYSVQTFTVQAVAAKTGTLDYAWSYQGLHDWYKAQAGLTAFAVDDAGHSNTVALVAMQTVSGNFSFDGGSASLQLTSGQLFGFAATGVNYDTSQTLEGTVTITALGSACTDLASDVDNCGACGHACAADAGCLAGACQ